MLVEAFPVEGLAEVAEKVPEFGVEAAAGGGDQPALAVAFENVSFDAITGAVDEAKEVGVLGLEVFSSFEGGIDDFLKARVGHWARSF